MCQKISKETRLSFNSVQTHYFLERILERIADSNEKENFIFKGGFLLANVAGIRQRNTVDIDFLAKRFLLTEENIKHRFEKILQSNKDDAITYEIQKIEEIRQEDEYGGFRLTIICKLGNIRQMIPLDIATGDPITPQEILYDYKSIFEEKHYTIYAYNIETILAEKLQTIYQRGVFNSRSKDFYDIFIIFHLKKDKIDYLSLKKACINTFQHRNTKFEVEDILEVLDYLRNENGLQTRWKNYQKKFSYAQEISFDSVINAAIDLVDMLKFI